jgi:hypothetical protein
LCDDIVDVLDKNGVVAELGLEPVAGWGLHATKVQSAIDSSPIVGEYTNCVTAPKTPYHPSREDFAGPTTRWPAHCVDPAFNWAGHPPFRWPISRSNAGCRAHQARSSDVGSNRGRMARRTPFLGRRESSVGGDGTPLSFVGHTCRPMQSRRPLSASVFSIGTTSARQATPLRRPS